MTTPAAAVLTQLAQLSRVPLPAAAIDTAARLFRHNVVMALAGRGVTVPGVSTERWPDGAPRLATATRLSDGAVVPAEHAVFTNALLMGARAQHDESPGAISHFGSSVIPALLAVAEQRGCSGQEVLSALVVGYEVGDRVGRALVGRTTERGFRPTGLFGPIASAAALATLLRLEHTSWVSAVALACNMSAGLTETWRAGTDEWKYQTALAARNGYHAALLAEAGAEGSAHTLEAPNGFQRAFAEVPKTVIATEPDENWAVFGVNLKLYPVCVFNQAAVQQIIELRGQVSDQAIETIEVRMHPGNVAYPGVNVHEPSATRAARLMSLPLSAAIAAHRGMVDVHDLEAPLPIQVQELARRVILTPDTAVPSHAAQVTLSTDAGAAARSETAPLMVDEARLAEVYRSLQPHTRLSAQTLDEVLKMFSALSSLRNLDGLIRSWAPSPA